MLKTPCIITRSTYYLEKVTEKEERGFDVSYVSFLQTNIKPKKYLIKRCKIMLSRFLLFELIKILNEPKKLDRQDRNLINTIWIWMNNFCEFFFVIYIFEEKNSNNITRDSSQGFSSSKMLNNNYNINLHRNFVRNIHHEPIKHWLIH